MMSVSFRYKRSIYVVGRGSSVGACMHNGLLVWVERYPAKL
jgi:hypothetical protein